MVDAAVPWEREPTYRSRRSSQHSNRSTESSLEDVNIAMEQDIHQIIVIEKIANYIAKMEVSNPEVMRVTYAFCAFQNVAAALRVGDGNFFHKSFKSQKISTFWSHSWHGGHWKKILTLLAFYNAPAALACGFLTAILMMILYYLQILPGFDRQKSFTFYFHPGVSLPVLWSPFWWCSFGDLTRRFSWIDFASAKTTLNWKLKQFSAWQVCSKTQMSCWFYGTQLGLRDYGASLSLLHSWKPKIQQESRYWLFGPFSWDPFPLPCFLPLLP